METKITKHLTFPPWGLVPFVAIVKMSFDFQKLGVLDIFTALLVVKAALVFLYIPE